MKPLCLCGLILNFLFFFSAAAICWVSFKLRVDVGSYLAFQLTHSLKTSYLHQVLLTSLYHRNNIWLLIFVFKDNWISIGDVYAYVRVYTLENIMVVGGKCVYVATH